jgi:phenylalanyl-tRNA synthetase alpha chain
MGFQTIEGPEVELDKYNFQKLNIPEEHPARDMWNSLWIDRELPDGSRPLLLRTHTSPMQIRTMESQSPPVRVVVPGKTYRYEATDATHEWQFCQIEGLAVDKDITFANLKATLEEFARRIFGDKRKARFRCDFFPFVEPGAEVSIDCFKCEGDGCRVCGNTGWIEIMGAGMVHPKVLAGVGYDPEIYSGFAWGMGAERIAMLKHGIDDIRHFYSNDMKFLKQFS